MELIELKTGREADDEDGMVNVANDAELVPHIHDLLTRMAGAAESMAGFAVRVGRLLIQKKADKGSIPHGMWEAWVEKTLGVEKRQANNYINAAKWVAANPHVDLREMSLRSLLALKAKKTETVEAEKPAKTKPAKPDPDDADESDDETDEMPILKHQRDKIVLLETQVREQAAQIEKLERELRMARSAATAEVVIPQDDLDCLVEMVLHGTCKNTSLEILQRLGAKLPPAPPIPTAECPPTLDEHMAMTAQRALEQAQAQTGEPVATKPLTGMPLIKAGIEANAAIKAAKKAEAKPTTKKEAAAAKLKKDRAAATANRKSIAKTKAAISAEAKKAEAAALNPDNPFVAGAARKKAADAAKRAAKKATKPAKTQAEVNAGYDAQARAEMDQAFAELGLD